MKNRYTKTVYVKLPSLGKNEKLHTTEIEPGVIIKDVKMTYKGYNMLMYITSACSYPL